MTAQNLVRSGVVTMLFGVAAFPQSPTPPPNSHATQLVQQFKARANHYLTWRKKAIGAEPGPTDSAEKLDAARHEMENKARMKRAGAKQGEIFTPEIAQYFRRQISATLNGPHGNEVRATLRHAEPVRMDLHINQSYPEDVPLQSTPPTLLLNLPELPKGLEYRILDRELVLRDAGANIVVDYVPNALPGNQK
jgi:hypothetical protein